MSARGLTWDHPRGYNALAAAGGPVTWETQPLEGFESAPIARLCADYDLVVLDHPHLGEALAEGCILPLDQLFDPADLARIADAAMGPSFASYAMAGRQWALPLDAATQVMALRPDLTEARPTSWDEVLRLSAEGGVALSLAGPHAALSFLSVCAALDAGLDLRDGGWVAPDVARGAYDILAELAAHSPASTAALNPIGILNHMSAQDDVALCPLIYGYVNYAGPGRAHPLRFANAPRAGGRPGSILGGTGIAVSRRCTMTDDLRAHLLMLMSDTAQRGLIPDNDGQPGLAAAWADPRVNAAWGNFYADTADTLRAAAIRPRHNGYIAFQTAASAHLRESFSARSPTAQAVDELARMFYASTGKVPA